MIERLPFVLRLSPFQLAIINNKKPWSGDQWKDEDIQPVKSEIRRQLEANQSCCAYCGLPFRGRKDMQIEHIAPKAKYRQPQFTFTLKNLVLSCSYCNDLIVKGAKQTVKILAPDYEDCEFLLVHPYFDDPDDHYEWVDENEKIIIQIKNESGKASFSINMFDLASTGMSELRACDAFKRRRHNQMPNSNTEEGIIEQVLDTKVVN
jgi:uncharacterized protein (TIGR02646 family)